jgi:hypothetical protein
MTQKDKSHKEERRHFSFRSTTGIILVHLLITISAHNNSSTTMTAITEYKLISTDEEGAQATGYLIKDSWKTYPGDRRIPQQEVGPRVDDMVFIRTGGNALQAVNRNLVESSQQLISVVVPDGKDPGDELLVACPFVKDRLISVTVPNNTTAGSAFLVHLPSVAPIIATGIPVDAPVHYEGHTPIVAGSDIDELALQEEENHSAPRTSQTTRDQQRSEKDPDEEEYELV